MRIEDPEADPQAVVTANATRFLDDHAGHFWPAAAGPERVRLGPAGRRRRSAGDGSERLAGQYVRANVEGPQRYVQSLPGSHRHRLRVDESGYDHLVLAGDWTNCGLNAGCIESATMSGLEAANIDPRTPADERDQRQLVRSRVVTTRDSPGLRRRHRLRRRHAPSPTEALRLAELAYDRVMAGVDPQLDTMPPELKPADAVRWIGDRVTELVAGFAELPLDRLVDLGAPTPPSGRFGGRTRSRGANR